MFTEIKSAEQLAQEKTQQEREQRIAELKQLLVDTDYVALKDYDKEKTDILAQRQQWRNEIRSLEAV